MLTRLDRFLLGPATIIVVLRLVAGDEHIHVGAPAALLAVWFCVDLIHEAIITIIRDKEQ